MEQEIIVPFASFELFLVYLVSGVGGVALAHILENFSWFRSMSSGHKFWSVLLLSVILPLVAIFLRHTVYGYMIDIDVVFRAVQASIIVFGSSQYAHATQLHVRQ